MNDTQIVDRRPPKWGVTQHGDFVRAVWAACEERKWQISRQVISVSRNKKCVTVTFCVHHPDVPDLGRGMQNAVTLLNARDGSRAMEAHAGVLLAPDELVILRECAKRRKHSRRLTPSFVIGQMLDSYTDAAWVLPQMVAGLDDVTVRKPYDTDPILMHAARRGVLPWSRVGAVDREFVQGSSWTLMRAFSRVVRRSPPQVRAAHSVLFAGSLPTHFREPSLNLY